jgi:hypothetical protein
MNLMEEFKSDGQSIVFDKTSTLFRHRSFYCHQCSSIGSVTTWRFTTCCCKVLFSVRESARTQQRHHWCWSTKTIRLCSLYGLQSHRMSELTLPPGHRQLRQFHSSSMVFADVHLKKSIFDCFYTSRLCKDPKFWFLYSRYLFHVGSVSHILSQQYTCYLIYY